MWQEHGVKIELREQLAAPAAIGDVEQERAGRVADLGGEGSRQAVPHVILGQENLLDPFPVRRLVLANPQELGRREPRQGRIGHHPHQRLEPARPFFDLLALGGGALIVPEQGRAHHLAGFVEEYRAVHLTRKPEARPRRPARTCRRRVRPEPS